jgi:hypothetical protein
MGGQEDDGTISAERDIAEDIFVTPDLRPEALLALADELEEQHTFSAFWSAVDDAVATLRAIAAPSQPMAGEPLAALLRDCREREYNPFEPDNQSRLYHRIVAALAQPMAGEPWALLREALTEALPLVEMFQRSESLTVVQRLHIVEVAERIRAALAQHGDKTCTKP